MADTSLTRTYSSLLTLTLDNVQKAVYDQIIKDHVVLRVLESKGFKDKQNGGEKIRVPLLYAKNTTFKAHSGYGVIDTTPQEGITAGFDEWREVAGTITISRKELRQNSGQSKIMSLLDQKVQQAQLSMSEVLNEMIISGTISGSAFVAGTNAVGGTDLNSIPMLIPDDPTASATIHEINQSTNSWWRTKQKDVSGSTTRATLKKDMMNLWNTCKKGSGGSGPDIGLSDQVTYETLELSFDDQKRIVNDDAMAKLGFDNFRLKGAAIMWDESVPDMDTPANTDTGSFTTGSLFYLNTQFLRWVVDSETDIITTPFVEPDNQTAITAKMLLMGQLIMLNRRKFGVATKISQSITS